MSRDKCNGIDLRKNKSIFQWKLFLKSYKNYITIKDNLLTWCNDRS